MATALSSASPSPAPSSSDAAESAGAGANAALLPSPGRVNRLRQDWAVHEDGALARRLQSQEFERHLGGNRQRNHQIREDFPKAFLEQSREAGEAKRVREERARRRREEEEADAEVARRVARAQEESGEEHRRYEALRDEVFAKRLQEMELKAGKARQRHQHQQVQHNDLAMPTPNNSANNHPTGAREKVLPSLSSRPDPQVTPPLPVLADGDVPQPSPASTSSVAAAGEHVRETSFHDLQGGLKYNDEQYLVKTAIPAVVTAEPLYANNKPEHYAVSDAFPSASAGAAGAEGASGSDDLLLGAATGLSQRDVAVSKQAEEQLEQERRDRELAARLQRQLSYTDETHADAKRALEARDLEVAKRLQEKEKARLKRAKERARQKKLERQMMEGETLGATANAASPGSAVESGPQSPHSRTDSRTSNHNNSNSHHQQQPQHQRQNSGSRAGSRLSRSSADRVEDSLGISDNHESRQQQSHHRQQSVDGGVESQQQQHSPDYPVPARRPYMNRSAIDRHQFGASGREGGAPPEEPTYENLLKVSPSQNKHSHIQKKQQQHHHLPGDPLLLPTPPYMPMQQSSSKKSSSMEKRLNKKKEKEGCKQQ